MNAPRHMLGWEERRDRHPLSEQRVSFTVETAESSERCRTLQLGPQLSNALATRVHGNPGTNEHDCQKTENKDGQELLGES